VFEAGGLPAEAAGLLLTGRDGGSIPVEVLVIPMSTQDRKVRTSVWIEALTADLNFSDESQLVEVYAYAVDSSEAVVASLLKVVEIRGEEGTPATRQNLRFHGELDLPSGQVRIRVLVRDHETGAVGLRTVQNELSILRRGDANLLPPFAHGAQRGWAFADAAIGEESGARALGGPLTARPIYRSGTARLNWASTGDWNSLVLVVECGEAKFEIEKVRFQTLGTFGPWTFGQAELQLPGTRSADCALRWRDADGRRPLTSELARAIVLGEDSPDRGSWTDLVSTSEQTDASGETGTAVEINLKDGLAIPNSEVESRLLQILKSLATADEDVWVAEMDRLETDALGGGPAYQDLGKAELSILRRATRANAEALIPVMDLYRRSYRHYQTVARPLLATHAVQMVRLLAGAYFESSSAEERGLFTADLLLLMASLPTGGSGVFAESLLKQALEHSPDHQAVTQRLAALYSRKGLFERSLPLLERLVERTPEAVEFRIRLAVAFDRTDRRKAAEQHLAEVIAREDTGWATALAYQELVRFRIESENWIEAEELLAAGLGRFPEDEKLLLLRANLWDLQRDATKARQWLREKIPEAVRKEGISPRHQLSKELEQLEGETADRWEEVVSNRRHFLTDVLEQSGS
jgi:tetratricopeptide (TPR) repeat protein